MLSKLMSVSLAVLIVVSFVSPASFSQNRLLGESVFSDYLNANRSDSFLRIPGLSFESSMGFSYMSFGNGFSAGYGYYMGHFSLDLSNSVTLHWDLGLRSIVSGSEFTRSPEFFIPNVDLTYRHSDKFQVRLQFQQARYPFLDRMY